MGPVTRRTIRHSVIGAIVGIVLGFVPLVLLIAPFIGGAVAGYLEREGPKRGAIAGGIAGIVMIALRSAIVGAIMFIRFGDVPLSVPWASPQWLGIAALFSVVSVTGSVLVAGIGGGLGGILKGDHRQADATSPGGSGDVSGDNGYSAVRMLGSLLTGFVTFAVVALAVTASLDPFIWPSAIVGLPAGVIAGAVVSVVVYQYLAHRSDPERDTNWKAIGIGALVIVVVFTLLIGGLFSLADRQVTETTQSSYQYDVSISADGTLEDVVFYVPVPHDGGTTEIGERFVEDAQYSRYTPSMEGYNPEQEPIEFDYELVETDHGPMLAISADRIEVTEVYYRTVENETMGWHERIDRDEYDPTDPSMGVQDDGRFEFSVTLAANGSIDTADPFGTEPLLTPKSDVQQIACRHAAEMARCYEYESRVYAEYGTDEETNVHVATELAGYNEWFRGGWSGNEYRDRTTIELLGPQSGWFRTPGELDVGIGHYRE